MRHRIAAAAVLLASIATVPVGVVSAHARDTHVPAPVHVYLPYCAAAEDNCRADYDGTRWTIRPVTP